MHHLEKSVILLHARTMTLKMEYYLTSLGLSSLTLKWRIKFIFPCLESLVVRHKYDKHQSCIINYMCFVLITITNENSTSLWILNLTIIVLAQISFWSLQLPHLLFYTLWACSSTTWGLHSFPIITTNVFKHPVWTEAPKMLPYLFDIDKPRFWYHLFNSSVDLAKQLLQSLLSPFKYLFLNFWVNWENWKHIA